MQNRRRNDSTAMAYCLPKPDGCGGLWKASLVGVDGRCYLCHQKDEEDFERRLLERLREELAHGAMDEEHPTSCTNAGCTAHDKKE